MPMNIGLIWIPVLTLDQYVSRTDSGLFTFLRAKVETISRL